MVVCNVSIDGDVLPWSARLHDSLARSIKATVEADRLQVGLNLGDGSGPLGSDVLLPAGMNRPRPSEIIEEDAVSEAIGVEEHGFAAPPAPRAVCER